MDSDEYSQRVAAAKKCWDRPTLEGIIELENHFSAGITLANIGATHSEYVQIKREVHICFGRTLVEQLRKSITMTDFDQLEDILSEGLVSYEDLNTSCREIDRFNDRLAATHRRCG